MNPPSTYLSNWRHSPFNLPNFLYFSRWKTLNSTSTKYAGCIYLSGLCRLQAKVLLASEQNSLWSFLKQWLITHPEGSNISVYGVCHNVESPGSWHHSSLTWTPKALPMAGLRYYGFLFSLFFIKSPLYGS